MHSGKVLSSLRCRVEVKVSIECSIVVRMGERSPGAGVMASSECCIEGWGKGGFNFQELSTTANPDVLCVQ